MNKRQRTGSFVLICTILFAVLAPAILSIGEFLGAGFEPYGNRISNISNYGLLCEYDSYLYFSNTADSGKLYKMKPDGTGYEKLSEDEVQYISVLSGVIYYTNLSDGGTLYSIKTDGSQRKKLNSENSVYVNVVGDTIYYVSVTDNWTLKKCTLSGSNVAYLGNQVRGFNLNVYEGYAYYIGMGDSLIYRMNLSSSGISKISTDKALQIVAYGSHVYYINAANSRVMQITNTGGTKRTYTDYPCSHLAVYNDILYFSLEQKGGILGSIKIADVYSDTSISSVYASCLNAAAGYMYFCNIYEVNSGFLYYGDMQRITYDGKTTQKMTDVTAAAAVIQKIEALPAPLAVKPGDSAQVAEARKAYDSLASAAKSLVPQTAVKKLEDVEQALGLEGPSYITSTLYAIDRSKKILTLTPEKTAASVLKSKVSGNKDGGTIQVYDAGGKELTTGNVGTGCKVRLTYKGSVVEELTVLLYGDVNGDGTISAMDLLLVQQHLLQIRSLNGIYFSAADITKDGKINAMDLLKIQQHLLKIIVLA